jgi:5-epimerase
VPEGVAHGVMALEDDSVISYLCSTGYNPGREHGLDPLDPAVGLPWPAEIEIVMSDKDRAAPTLAAARESGLLPSFADCQAYYQRLRTA